MELKDIKGVGEKTVQAFNKLGIYDCKDLINYYPRDYDVFKSPETIDEMNCMEVCAVKGVVATNPILKKIRNLTITSIYIKDEKGNKLKLTWFNMPYISKMLKIGYKYIFRGRVTSSRFDIADTMEQPAIYTLEQYEKKLNFMQPVYSLKKGISNTTVLKAVNAILNSSDAAELMEEFIPSQILKENELIPLEEALNKIHFPENKQELLNAKKRLIFNEFFMFIYALRHLKTKETATTTDIVISDFSLSEYIANNLPYTLTVEQQKVLNEIKADISSGTLMNRLVQGDVGCGKTIIAFLVLADMVNAGYQGALMVPTEVLANQHFESLMELKTSLNLKVNPVLLTGSQTRKEKKEIYDGIKEGVFNIIIGTHAIIQDSVEYNNLGLVITDEQHRFGVRQREKLANKGNMPHILVMSATPIPRTLGIIMYGDLDISIIDKLPANRLPIKNCVITREERRKAVKFIEKQVAAGRQAYVICPMVWENETVDASDVVSYTKLLKESLSHNINVEYLHGKMTPKEKNDIMDKFLKNQINVLVSTTVVEVGVNVPNATVMVIEDADRFGLASLHQLRGRVGRGHEQSYCIFVSGNNSKAARERLEIINKSNDGFFIAKEDLKLRGSGDFFGVRQSGDVEFKLADIFNNADLLKMTSDIVDKLNNSEYSVGEEEKNKLINKINEYIVIHIKLNL